MDSAKELVKDFLQKTFDIREGEYHRVFLMQVYIFLIIFTLLLIKPVVNAQFIATNGIQNLPLVFVLVALFAMVVSTIYSKALNNKSLKSVTSITLGVSIGALILFGLLLQFNVAEDITLYALYIGVAIFGVLATSQFWIMANLVFDAREAKRLFSFIGVGPIVGGVAGGYMASIIASLISGNSLLFLGAALLCVCLPLNNRIWSRHIKHLTNFQRKKRFLDFGDHPIWLIRKSKHLTYLALVIGLSVLVSKLVEFQFSSVALRNFSDPDMLTAFFGFWFSTFNVVSLLIQLFLTKRVVGIYGVGSSLFVLPGGVILGSLILLFSPILLIGIFTKLWEVSIRQSINKSATELLSLPIPTAMKSQTKSFIDVFVDLAATGVAGLFLLLLVNGFNLPMRWVSLLTVTIGIVWVWVAIKVRQEYVNSFKSKLTQADKNADKALPDFNSVSVLNGLKRALETGTEKQIIYVLDKVQEISDKRLFENVLTFLSHASPRVREKALQCIYYLQQTVELPILEALMQDDDMEVRFKAFAQLLRQSKEGRMTIINKYLLNSDPKLSGAALVGLAEEARNNHEMMKMLRLEQRILDKIDYLNFLEDKEEINLFQIMILRSIGQANISSCYHFIEGLLNSEDDQVQKEAILAAGYTMNIQFVPQLVPFLEFKETRKTTQDALLNYGVGIIPELERMARESEVKSELTHFFPGVLERIDSVMAVNALFGFLDLFDVNLRLEALRALNTMHRNFPHLKIRKEKVISKIIDESNNFKSMLSILYKQKNELLPGESSEVVNEARANLIEVVERRLDGTIERIFRLIGLRYPPEDIITVYNGLKSNTEHVRINSVEFLDNLLEPNLRKTLLPIAEIAIFPRLTEERLENLKVKIPDEMQGLSMLLEGKDARLKMAVFDLISALDDKRFLPIVIPTLESKNEKVRERAREVIVQLERD